MIRRSLVLAIGVAIAIAVIAVSSASGRSVVQPQQISDSQLKALTTTEGGRARSAALPLSFVDALQLGP